MLGRFVAVFLILAAVSCARPRYLSGDDTKTAQKARVYGARLPSGISVWMTWEKLPTAKTYGAMLLKLGRPNRADGSPVVEEIEGEIAVELWMPSMGHGSSPVTVERADVGTYMAGKVFFTMPGDWEIRVQRIVEGVIVETATIPIRW